MDWLVQKIHERARFSLFDIGKGFFEAVLAAQANVDQAFVNFEFVLKESNLQLFSAEAAAQALDLGTSTAVRFVGRVLIPGGALYLSHQELRLVVESRGIQILQGCQCCPAVLSRKRGIAQAQ